MFRALTRAQLVTDLVIAGFVLLLFAFYRVADPAGMLVLLILVAAFAIRNLSPALALIVAWAGAIAQLLFWMDPDPASILILPVLYATARHGTPPVKWAGLVSAFAGALLAAAYLALRSVFWWSDCRFYGYRNCLALDDLPGVLIAAAITFVLCLGVFLLAWTLGQLMRVRRASEDAEVERILAERRRIDQQQLVHHLEERNRIARDMHDVVAHSLAVVIAQADGARYALKSDPDVAGRALGTISATARDALADVRVLLARLRHDEGDAPQPGLGELGKLVEQLTLSGLTVEVMEEGEARPLSAGAQLAVYRIIQEALTNALRHGDTAHPVRLTLSWSERELALEVQNRTVADVAQAPVQAGYGTAGMQERALLAGGSLEIVCDGDDYLVSARVPTATEEGE